MKGCMKIPGLGWCPLPSRSSHFNRWRRRPIHCHWDSWNSRCNRNT